MILVSITSSEPPSSPDEGLARIVDEVLEKLYNNTKTARIQEQFKEEVIDYTYRIKSAGDSIKTEEEHKRKWLIPA